MDTSDRSPEPTSAARSSTELPPELVERTYAELRAVARRTLTDWPAAHSVNATALVHDAWVAVAEDEDFRFLGQRPFVAYVSLVIRRILVDHVRSRQALRRGGGRARVPFVESAILDSGAVELTALDAALADFERIQPRQARVVQMRFFGGLSEDEVAAELGLTKRTVSSDFRSARTWLRRRLRAEGLR